MQIRYFRCIRQRFCRTAIFFTLFLLAVATLNYLHNYIFISDEFESNYFQTVNMSPYFNVSKINGKFDRFLIQPRVIVIDTNENRHKLGLAAGKSAQHTPDFNMGGGKYFGTSNNLNTLYYI